MAYQVDPATYSALVFQDNMSGSPDQWTDGGGGTHSYASSELTVVDDTGGSEYVYRDVTVDNGQPLLLVQFGWKFTATGGANSPVIFQFNDTTFTNLSAGILFRNRATIDARNGAAWTATGFTPTSSTYYDVSILIDRTAGTYEVYFNTTSIGTYTMESNVDAAYDRLIIGGGDSAATWTYVFNLFLLKQGPIVAQNKLLSLLGVGT